MRMRYVERFCTMYERSVMSAEKWEVSHVGVGTVLFLERDVLPVVEQVS